MCLTKETMTVDKLLAKFPKIEDHFLLFSDAAYQEKEFIKWATEQRIHYNISVHGKGTRKPLSQE